MSSFDQIQNSDLMMAQEWKSRDSQRLSQFILRGTWTCIAALTSRWHGFILWRPWVHVQNESTPLIILLTLKLFFLSSLQSHHFMTNHNTETKTGCWFKILGLPKYDHLLPNCIIKFLSRLWVTTSFEKTKKKNITDTIFKKWKRQKKVTNLHGTYLQICMPYNM